MQTHLFLNWTGRYPMLMERLLTRYLRRVNPRMLRFEAREERAPLPEAPDDGTYLLYLHVPFCETLCPYCSFHRVQYREQKARVYFEALRREIELIHAAGYRFGEVYVGGGTPTVLPDELARTLDLLRSVSPVRQVSVETNPDHLVPAVMDTLVAAGVDRLSVGVQSFDDELLRQMDRYEQYGGGDDVLERLAAAQTRFRTVNTDLIFNLPAQTEAMLARDIERVRDDLEAAQVSFYPLMAAPVTEKKMAETMGVVDYRREHRLYQMILDGMEGTDYRASSAWCFSKGEGMIDEYIVDHDDYVGLGSGSFSFLDGTLYSSTFSINRYLDYVSKGRVGIVRSRRFGLREQLRYAMLMKLFGLEMDKAAMRAKFGRAFPAGLAPELAALRAIGAVRDEGERYALTRRGMYLWVVMMREFFVAVNALRAEMRAHLHAELRDPALPMIEVPLADIARRAAAE